MAVTEGLALAFDCLFRESPGLFKAVLGREQARQGVDAAKGVLMVVTEGLALPLDRLSTKLLGICKAVLQLENAGQAAHGDQGA